MEFRLVAGPGLRSPVKRDYEPREILTSPPHVMSRSYYITANLHLTVSGKLWVNEDGGKV